MNARSSRVFSVCFLQCQVSMDLPHMNMPLFVDDLRGIGCAVDCACVAQSRFSAAVPYLARKNYRVIFFDYLFPAGFINALQRRFPRSVFVTGGHGCLDVFLKSAARFAVVGAGRKSVVSLVRSLKDGGDPRGVANTFFKRRAAGRTVIDHSGVDRPFMLAKELFPYRPQLEWEYLGFPRSAESAKGSEEYTPAPLVADFGCPCRSNSVRGSASCVRLPEGYHFSARASARIAAIIRERSSGCSFCTYPGFASCGVTATVDALMKQLTFLYRRYGYQRFAINSEQPFGLLLPFLRRITSSGLPVSQLNIRSRVSWLLGHAGVLREAAQLAQRSGLQLVVWQVGFESFLQQDLDLYRKNVTVQDNLTALRLLDRLAADYPGHFSHHSHGFIAVHPWTRLEDIKKQLALMRRFRAERFAFPAYHTRLSLYDPFLPIYQRIRDAGLLIRRKQGIDGYRCVDSRISRFLSLAVKLESFLSRSCRGLADRPATSRIVHRLYRRAIDGAITALLDGQSAARIYARACSQARPVINRLPKAGPARGMVFVRGAQAYRLRFTGRLPRIEKVGR